jgi:hypothetical protein
MGPAAPFRTGSSKGVCARYVSGAAIKLVRHPSQQKWYVLPSCSALIAVFGSTIIPHTGSRTRVPAPAFPA